MVVNSETDLLIRRVLGDMLPKLNEMQRRQLQGSIADALGYGGVAYVKSLTGTARNTIHRGIDDLNKGTETDGQTSTTQGVMTQGIRKSGAGRKKESEKNPKLYQDIEKIIDPDTYENPRKPLRWTTLSMRKIAEELRKKGYNVSQNIVSRELETLGYSKQKNQQIWNQHPDREAQFQHINETAQAYLEQGEPVISVDTKKKENIGDYNIPGAEYRKENFPRQIIDYDFPIQELRIINPYGVYVLNEKTGFVNLGTSHAEYAGEGVYWWWETVGKNTFPEARKLYINYEGSGSDSSSWEWKYKLQLLANKTGLEIEISHFPPGTSKWTKVEHRLFCYLSKNWQFQSLIDIETVVSLIGSTATPKGIEVICQADSNVSETGKKISEEEKVSINIEFLEPFLQWNYIIRPNKTDVVVS